MEFLNFFKFLKRFLKFFVQKILCTKKPSFLTRGRHFGNFFPKMGFFAFSGDVCKKFPKMTPGTQLQFFVAELFISFLQNFVMWLSRKSSFFFFSKFRSQRPVSEFFSQILYRAPAARFGNFFPI